MKNYSSRVERLELNESAKDGIAFGIPEFDHDQLSAYSIRGERIARHEGELEAALQARVRAYPAGCVVLFDRTDMSL